MCEIVNPAAPASASWTTEIWPTKPVTTTSDSAISAPISVLISASRKSNGNTISSTAPTSPQISPVRDQVLRPRRLGQPPLDELAAAGDARRRARTARRR